MKKFSAILIISILTINSASALELSSSFALGNLSFDNTAASSIGMAGDAFAGTWTYGGFLSAAEKIGDSVSFSAGFERDSILRNVVFTRVGFDAGFAKLSVGPFFGPFNAEGSVLSSGISTNLRLEMPGVIFGSFRSDSTIGAGLAAPGDYVQERSEVLIGFWVPSIMISARLASQSFTYKKASDLTTVDERTRYEFVADTFKKNVPYTIRLNIGYENLKRSYVGATSATTYVDELGAAILGLETSMQFSDVIRVSIGAEGALYAWGIGDLGSPATSLPFFTAHVGLTLVFPAGGDTAETERKSSDDQKPASK
ncbi:MAG: hypothetical protein WCT14_14740 [Treponemataceae bacterium]